MTRSESPSTIRAIEALLVGRIGLDPASVSPSLVSRGVRHRMAALGLHDLRLYESMLRDSPGEVQELVDEVVIPESWFFRDERPFRFLQDFARQRLADAPLRLPLRILSIPCARGEEPLSVAMALLDAGLRSRQFRIDGVDIGARNLEHARRGLYTSNSFRGSDLGFRERYFQQRGGGFQVEPSILETIRFQRASVLDPDLLAGEPPYDVILCRNLLIYLTSDAKARAIKTLDRLLAEDGLLLIGHADPLGQEMLAGPNGPPAFAPVGDPACFAFRKAKGSGKPAPASPERHRPTTESAEEATIPIERAASDEMRRNPPSTDSPTATAAVPPLLEQAGELANLGRHDEAIRLIETQLRVKGPNAPAFHLMGIILQASGDRERAERCFHKAVYLDPHHDEALLALALLADRRGDASAASGYRRRAERALATKGVS